MDLLKLNEKKPFTALIWDFLHSSLLLGVRVVSYVSAWIALILPFAGLFFFFFGEFSLSIFCFFYSLLFMYINMELRT